MKNTALILSIFFSSVFSSNAQHTLTVKITNLKTNKGIVRVQLFDVNHKTVTKVTSLVEKDEVKLLLTNIPSGKYAIQYYQDENSNQKLDANMLGIPTEGYGFSNNAYSMFGPKPFANWLFEVNKDEQIVLKTN